VNTKSRIVLSTCISTLLAATAAQAALYTWDSDTGTAGAQDGAGAWNTTGANWLSNGSNVPFGNTNADTAIFGAASGAAGTVTVTSATANAITFNAAGSGNYTLTGGTITLGGASATLTANANATIASVLSSGTSVTKSGTGILTLDPGASVTSTIGNLKTTAGGLAVSSGSLNVSNSGAAGGASGLYVNGGTFTVNGGVVTTSGYVTVNNGGTLLVSSGTFIETGAEVLNGYGSGSTVTLAGGLMSVADLRVCQTNASTVNLNGGILQTNFFNYGGGTATVNFNGSTVQARSTQAAFLNATSAITYNVQANGAIFDSNGYAITISTPLVSGTSNDGGLTKLGAGTLTLSATNTYAGPTVVSSGTLQIGGTSGMLTGTGAVTVAPFATLLVGDSTAANNNGIVNRINPAAALSLGGAAGGATVSMAVPATTTTGTLASVTLNGGFNNIGATGATGATNLAFTGAGGAGCVRNGNSVLMVTSSTGFNPQFTNAPTAAGGSAVSGTAKPILVGVSLNGNDLVAAAAGSLGAPAYDTIWASDATLNVTGGNIAASTNSVNALRLNDNTGARTVTLLGTGTTVVQSGMILVGSAAVNGQTVTGGTITSGNGRDLIVWDSRTVGQRDANAFNLSPVISDNGGTKIALTVAGGNGSAGYSGGQVWLNNNNNYTGGTILNGGSVDISADTAFGAVQGSPQTNITVIGGGWIKDNVAVTLNANRNVTLAANSVLTLDGQNGALAVNGAISGAGNLSTPANRTSLVVLNGTNTFTGYYYSFGTLRATDGVGLPSAANLQLSGNSITSPQQGMLETSGTFTRSLGTGANQVQWLNYGGGGFGAYGGPLTVALGGTASPAALTWSAGGFVFGGSGFDLQDSNSNSTLAWLNPINLGGAVRTLSIGGPAAISNSTAVTMSGVLSNGGITLAGGGNSGLLILTATNTCAQATTVNAGVLRAVDGIGLSGSSLLTLNGGVFETSGNFTRTLGSAAGNVQITGGVSGFSTNGGAATIALGGTASPTALTWGAANFNPATLVLNEVTANNTLTFANAIDLSGSSVRTINVNANTATIVGALTGGTTGLTKGGAGTLVLAGANTYGGITTLASGTVNLGAAETLGTSGPLGASTANNPGSVVLNGAYLQYSVANQNDYSGRFSTAANQQYNVDTNGQTVTWATPLSSTNGSLTKTGLGTLTLTGSSTYAGATTVNSGTLQIGAGGTTGAIGSTSGIAVASGATLAFNRTDNYGGNFTPAITGSGGLVLTGGTLTLSGANTFTGDTLLNGGTLTTGIATALQNSTLNYNNQGGTLSFGTLTAATLGGLKGAQSLTLLNTSGTGVNLSVGNNNASTIYTGILTGTNSASTLTKVGAGTLTLDPGAAASGTIAAVALNAGTLTLNSGTTNLSGAVTVATGAALNLTGGSVTIGGNYPIVNGTMNVSGGTFSGGLELLISFNNSGGVVNLSGSGVLNGNQIRMGNGANVSTLNLNGGTLRMAFLNGGGNTSGTVNLNGSTLQANYSAPDFLNNKSTYNVLAGGAIFDTAGYNPTVQAALLSGAVNDGGLTKNGAGTLTVSASNSYTGATTINAGTLSLASANALAGGGNITFGGGALQFSGSNTNDYSGRIVNSGGAIALDTNGQSIAFGNGLAASNAGGLTVLGNGILTLSGSNAYTGATTVSSGTLQISGVLGSSSYSGAISNAGALIFGSSASQLLSGAVSGIGSLSQSGSGTLTLTGSNSYTGATTVNSGTLQIGNGTNGSLAAASAITINSGGTLALNLANTGTCASTIYNFGGIANLLAGGTTTVSGQIYGYATGIMNQSGTGTTILTNNNDFSGTTNISAGVLQLGYQYAANNSTINVGVNNGLAFGVTPVTIGGLSGTSGFALLTTSGTTGVALTVGNNNQNSSYTGTITGTNAAASLTKTGTATFTYAPVTSSTINTLYVSQGMLLLTGGTLTVPALTVNGTGVFEQTGGTVNANPYPNISGAGGATLNVLGGNFQGAAELLIGFGGAVPGTVNVSGSGTLSAFYLRIGNGSNATVNLSTGGTIQTARFYTQGGGSTLNLNGGTVQVVTQGRPDFMQGLTSAYINAGGVTFDTNGFNSTAAQPLLTGTGLPGNDGGLTKIGAGTLTLSGSNTYNGGTTVNAGILQLGNASGLGASTGNLAVNGGTLDLNGNSAAVGTLSGSTGTVITTSSNASVTLTLSGSNSGTFSGIIQNGSGTVGLTQAGTANLTLAGANTYSGDTVLNSGTLTLGTVTALQNSTLNYQGGALSFGTQSAATLGGLKGSQNVALLNTSGSGVALTVGGDNQSTTYTGVITATNSAATLTKVGAGALALAAGAATSATIANVAVTAGTLALNSGTLTVSIAAGFRVGGAGGPAFNLNGGTLVTNGNPTIIGGDLPGGKGAFTLTSGTWTQTGGFIGIGYGSLGNGSVLNVNGGLLSVAGLQLGQNAGTETMNLNGGVVQVNNLFNSPGATGILNFNGGVLRAASAANAANFVNFTGTANVLTGGATIDTNGYNVTAVNALVSGTAGDGGLTKIGAGTLTLSASNSYNGGTTLSNGMLQVGNANALGTGGLTVNSGTLDLHGNSVSVGAFGGAGGSVTSSVSGTSRLTTGVASGSSTYAGVIANGTGIVALTKSGAGTLALSASNSYGGGTIVNCGTLNVNADQALGAAAGSVTVNDGATLQTSGSFAFNSSRNVILSGSATIDTQGNTNTISGIVSGSTATLVKQGSGTLILSGSLGIMGLNAAGGVTQLGQSGSIGAVNVASVGTLSMAAHSGSNYNVLNISSLTISGFSSSLTAANNDTADSAAYTPVSAPSRQNAGVLTDTGRAMAQTATMSDAVPASPEAVPEPGAWGMLLSGLGLLLSGRRRKANVTQASRL